MSENRKTVFISYSWDSPEHQQWVLKLAKDLTEKYGVIVLLDQYHLNTGSDLPYFMEQSIEKADKVLVVLTPNYKVRAEERKSGVGYESTMITQEIFESPITKIKFLPILRVGSSQTSSPRFLKSKVYHNMVDDKVYYSELLKLAKLIYDKPVIDIPVLGAIPDFNEPTFDPIIDSASSFLSEERLNRELNQIINSTAGVNIYDKEIDILNSLLKEKVDLYKTSTGLNFTYESNDRDATVIHCENFSVSFYWSGRFTNTAEHNKLIVRRWSGFASATDNRFYFPDEKPVMLSENNYKFNLNYSNEVVWTSSKEHLSTGEIIQNSFIFLIEEIKKVKSKNFRNK
ncbi:toll/interleukin-1 receptor domain-containing protein [Flavobacterium sp. 2]|uniref:toll/interleukin-1 receptor domain-containing protein n=1 Tax=Flavobacterium sp. 2 TaxID=308053 RepID=UPI003CF93F48